MDTPDDYAQRLEQALQTKRELIRELWAYLESLRPIPDVAVHDGKPEGADEVRPPTPGPADY